VSNFGFRIRIIKTQKRWTGTYTFRGVNRTGLGKKATEKGENVGQKRSDEGKIEV
jgi:hypothetical protein